MLTRLDRISCASIASTALIASFFARRCTRICAFKSSDKSERTNSSSIGPTSWLSRESITWSADSSLIEDLTSLDCGGLVEGDVCCRGFNRLALLSPFTSCPEEAPLEARPRGWSIVWPCQKCGVAFGIFQWFWHSQTQELKLAVAASSPSTPRSTTV